MLKFNQKLLEFSESPRRSSGAPKAVEVEHRSVSEEFGCMPHMVAVDAAGAVQHLDCSCWEPELKGKLGK